jgi:hypothetical protein
VRGRARRLGIAAAAIAWWLVSCRELGTPQGGVASVSRVLLPSPGLVAGDTMRDSTGLVAPLRVVAFGANGDTVANAATTFVAIDTGAHFAGALMIGDNDGRAVRVVGSVEGLQTRPETVKVTVSPDTLVPADSTRHFKTYTVLGDTVVASTELSTVVQHTGGASVQAVIVRYALEANPPGAQQTLVNGNTASDRDTTDANGRASRTLRIQRAKKVTGQGDTTTVSATASYKGRLIGRVLFMFIIAMP